MYAGNSTIVNLFMRWPILVPIAAAVGIATTVPEVVAPPPPPVVVVAPPPPVVVSKPKPPPIETICPPYDKTAKLHAKEKQALRARGCAVKG